VPTTGSAGTTPDEGQTIMRRIVTGWTEQGEPTILFDDRPPVEIEDRLMRSAEVWLTSSAPPDLRDRRDSTLREWSLEPDPGGSIFRLVTFLPGATSGSHATETLDYLVVLSGEIVLEVGGEEREVAAGDLIVQNGTPHNWINRSEEPCVMAGVLLSARRA
jgi:quercetin dioxygenase-like cupin family protein